MSIAARAAFASTDTDPNKPHWLDFQTARTVDNDPMWELRNGGVVVAKFVWDVTRSKALLATDEILEDTAAAGVTIDGVLLKDGGATFSNGVKIESIGPNYPDLDLNNTHASGKDYKWRSNDGGFLTLSEDAVERLRINGGIFAWGTTVTTGASAGDVMLANGKGLRGVDGAGTGTRTMVRLDSTSQIQIAPDGGAVGIGNPANMTANAGDLVIGASASIRKVNAAGTGTFILVDDAYDHPRIGPGASIVIVPTPASLLASHINHSGGICVDTATNRIYYYSGSQRFYLTGTLG